MNDCVPGQQGKRHTALKHAVIILFLISQIVLDNDSTLVNLRHSNARTEDIYIRLIKIELDSIETFKKLANCDVLPRSFEAFSLLSTISQMSMINKASAMGNPSGATVK